MERPTTDEVVRTALAESVAPGRVVAHTAVSTIPAGAIGLTRAIGTVALVASGVKLASLVQELVVTHRFGVGSALDAAAVALIVPMLLVNLIGASTAEALVPVHARTTLHDGSAAAAALERRVVLASARMLALAGLAVAAAAPLIVSIVAPGFDADTARLATRLLMVGAAIVPLAGLSLVYSRLLNVRGRFVAAASAAAAVPTTVTIGVVGFGARFGIEALAVATSLGYALQLLIIKLALDRRHDRSMDRQGEPVHTSHPRMGELRRTAVPLACAALLTGSAPIVDDAFASRLGPGSVAALHLGSRLLSLLVAVAALALGTAIAPVFARMAAVADDEGLRRTARRVITWIIAVVVPASALLALVSTPLVRLAFQRGAFDGADTKTVAAVQAIAILQLGPYLITTVWIRALAALDAARTFASVAAGAVVGNLVLDAVLAPRFGLRGIAWSSTIVAVGTAAALWQATTKAIAAKTERPGS